MGRWQDTDRTAIRFHIKGGAGPYEATAITAAVEQALAEERQSSTPPSPRFSTWKVTTWSEPFVPPRAITNGAKNGGPRPSAPRASRPSTS